MLKVALNPIPSIHHHGQASTGFLAVLSFEILLLKDRTEIKRSNTEKKMYLRYYFNQNLLKSYEINEEHVKIMTIYSEASLRFAPLSEVF